MNPPVLATLQPKKCGIKATPYKDTGANREMLAKLRSWERKHGLAKSQQCFNYGEGKR